MIAPLYETGVIGDGAALAAALALGVGFGFFLERGGMGSAPKLAGQFYLRDLSVFKLMFSAILTAMLGLYWLSRLGVVDPARVYVPETYVLPQLAGGAVFGLGFVLAGLCPGTSCVAAAAGRVDGLATVAGMLAGVVAFAEAFPLLAGFYGSTPMGTATLPGVLGISHGLAIAAVTTAALAGFAAAEAVERRAAAQAGGGR